MEDRGLVGGLRRRKQALHPLAADHFTQAFENERGMMHSKTTNWFSAYSVCLSTSAAVVPRCRGECVCL